MYLELYQAVVVKNRLAEKLLSEYENCIGCINYRAKFFYVKM